MLWLDYDFDQNDQLARQYMKYQGRYYDIGTKVKIKGPRGAVKATFVGWKYRGRGCFISDNQSYFDLYDNYDFSAANKYIEEIIEPVYPNLQLITTSTNQREKPPSWDVEVAWIWYIVIMAVAVIFKDRWLIWGFVSAVFFLWKGGFLKGGKK